MIWMGVLEEQIDVNPTMSENKTVTSAKDSASTICPSHNFCAINGGKIKYNKSTFFFLSKATAWFASWMDCLNLSILRFNDSCARDCSSTKILSLVASGYCIKSYWLFDEGLYQIFRERKINNEFFLSEILGNRIKGHVFSFQKKMMTFRKKPEGWGCRVFLSLFLYLLLSLNFLPLSLFFSFSILFPRTKG